MKVIKRPLGFYVNLMKQNKPFTLARYGDGEWLTILGYTHLHNSNGCSFTKELGDDLRKALNRQNDYYHAILKIAKRERVVLAANGKKKRYGISAIDQFLKKNKITMSWYDGDVILESNLNGEMFPLVEQIRMRRVLYVGNVRLRDLNFRGIGFFPYVAFVQPPAQNAHKVKNAILNEVFQNISKHQIDFVGWSSGLASKIMIDEVFIRFPHVTQIDFGSTFDGYFRPLQHILDKPTNNTGSRSYIRKGGYDWDKLRRLNTGLEIEE